MNWLKLSDPCVASSTENEHPSRFSVLVVLDGFGVVTFPKGPCTHIVPALALKYSHLAQSICYMGTWTLEP